MSTPPEYDPARYLQSGGARCQAIRTAGLALQRCLLSYVNSLNYRRELMVESALRYGAQMPIRQLTDGRYIMVWAGLQILEEKRKCNDGHS
jgi:hypothetical protein